MVCTFQQLFYVGAGALSACTRILRRAVCWQSMRRAHMGVIPFLLWWSLQSWGVRTHLKESFSEPFLCAVVMNCWLQTAGAVAAANPPLLSNPEEFMVSALFCSKHLV